MYKRNFSIIVVSAYYTLHVYRDKVWVNYKKYNIQAFHSTFFNMENAISNAHTYFRSA